MVDQYTFASGFISLWAKQVKSLICSYYYTCILYSCSTLDKVCTLIGILWNMCCTNWRVAFKYRKWKSNCKWICVDATDMHLIIKGTCRLSVQLTTVSCTCSSYNVATQSYSICTQTSTWLKKKISTYKIITNASGPNNSLAIASLLLY